MERFERYFFYRLVVHRSSFFESYLHNNVRIKTRINPIRKIEVNISLLYRATQLGKKISKLSFGEFEYFLAKTVKGQNILKINRTSPSPKTSPIPTHV